MEKRRREQLRRQKQVDKKRRKDQRALERLNPTPTENGAAETENGAAEGVEGNPTVEGGVTEKVAENPENPSDQPI